MYYICRKQLCVVRPGHHPSVLYERRAERRSEYGRGSTGKGGIAYPRRACSSWWLSYCAALVDLAQLCSCHLVKCSVACSAGTAAPGIWPCMWTALRLHSLRHCVRVQTQQTVLRACKATNPPARPCSEPQTVGHQAALGG